MIESQKEVFSVFNGSTLTLRRVGDVFSERGADVKNYSLVVDENNVFVLV